ncbi:MAG: hypothetical protein KKG25_00580 [Bacteroidetes bacterium]|nr:hypothetical protein [Bacteroidota bacterium]MBU1483334.1 hypothetical protein [Bacteroidota bacterium]MBU2267624.1 hypothetical protein [Bacteroidota bacterium]MBU2376707.1 hypothetical protein [Bacteroidota bacterium]
MSKKIIITVTVILVAVIAITFFSKSEKTNKISKNNIDTLTKTNLTIDTSANHNVLVGVWYDESIKSPDGGKVVYEIISKNQQIFMQAVSFKGENLKVSDMPKINDGASELKINGEEYISIENPNTSFKIDKHGDLYIFDIGKLVVKCSRIM